MLGAGQVVVGLVSVVLGPVGDRLGEVGLGEPAMPGSDQPLVLIQADVDDAGAAKAPVRGRFVHEHRGPRHERAGVEVTLQGCGLRTVALIVAGQHPLPGAAHDLSRVDESRLDRRACSYGVSPLVMRGLRATLCPDADCRG